MKKFVLVVVIFSLSFAREDPFTPVIVPKDSIRPYYGETRVFDSAKIEFPSSARLIKKVEVTFQNIDGSLQTRSIAVRGRIDWRMPLIISQELTKKQILQIRNFDRTPTPRQNITDSKPKNAKSNAKAIDKSPESKETITRESAETAREMRIAGNNTMTDSQVVDSSKASQKAQNDMAQNTSKKVQQNPQIIAQKQNFVQDIDLDIETTLSKIDSQGFTQDSAQNMQDSRMNLPQNPNANPRQKLGKSVPYSINGNSIFIRYRGNLLRHYIMQNPYRIVLDFEINTNDYRKNAYNINAPYFKRLRYGLHTQFLRMVLELDGSYVYNLEKLNDGVKIDVK